MSRTMKDAAFDALAELPAAVSHGDRLVWLLLADRHSDLRGYAWPRLADIAARAGLNADWVGKAIGRLEAAEILVVQRRPGCTNRYHVVIPNPRGERGGIDAPTPAPTAGGPAVSAGDPRGERGRNQLENQLENLAPIGADFSLEHNTETACGHRWVTEDGYCGTCHANAARGLR